MILVKSPLRITLGGGGSDLPSYADRFGGFCLAASINKFVYVAITRPFYPGIYLKYSELEKCDNAAEIQHPIFRELLGGQTQIEVTTLADVPAGTGLGSSSSFTTALLQALAVWDHERFSPHDLARQACAIELGRLKQPIGRQDQFIAAYGGLCAMTFCDGNVEVTKPVLSHLGRHHLEDHLLLFFTGHHRVTTDLLHDQDQRTRHDEAAMLQNLHETKQIGLESLRALEQERFEDFGTLLNEQWHLKASRQVVPADIIDAYEHGRAHGAIGGKLVGAGGGGFLLFYANDPAALRAAMTTAGFDELRFAFDYDGATVVLS